LSQEDVAQSLGISRPTYIAIEQGRREAQPEEAITLARLLGRQLHELVRPTPAVVGLAGQFRLGGTEQAEQMSASVDQLQRLADAVVELETVIGSTGPRQYPEPYDVSGIPVEAAADQLADSERRRLGLGDGPLPQLREILENDVGLRVFAVPLPSRVAGLFGHAEPAGSCIALNASHPHERQRWTLAHEYAHFLTSRWAAEVTDLPHGRASATERFADAFAARFLMPASGVTRRFQAMLRSRQGEFTAGDLLQLASLYEVSPEALALRLEDLRLLAAGWWPSLTARGLKVEQAKRVLGLPARQSDVDLLPRRIRYLAVEAYLRGAFSEGQLAQFLHQDRATTRRLVRQLSETADVDPDGQWLDVSWEPGDRADVVAR
jgi:Zn-dependent peptidase ImmA (M78 family)/DNA-binding XRE family transcriptional regulator